MLLEHFCKVFLAAGALPDFSWECFNLQEHLRGPWIGRVVVLLLSLLVGVVARTESREHVAF